MQNALSKLTCYFFIKDQVNANEVKINWCLTKDMIVDFFTKLLQGSALKHFCDMILDVVPSEKKQINW